MVNQTYKNTGASFLTWRNLAIILGLTVLGAVGVIVCQTQIDHWVAVVFSCIFGMLTAMGIVVSIVMIISMIPNRCHCVDAEPKEKIPLVITDSEEV